MTVVELDEATVDADGVEATSPGQVERRLSELERLLVGGFRPMPAGGLPALIADAAAEDGTGDGPQAVDAFQVVFLPDFEEQIAVQNKNWIAYGAYDLHFADGWQLTGVGGSWDTTEVPARFLQSISTALTAAAEVESTRLRTLPLMPGVDFPKPDDTKGMDIQPARPTGPGAIVLITKRRFIQPGMYRLRKWSDPDSSCSQTGAFGLLSEMGIPVVEETQVELIENASGGE